MSKIPTAVSLGVLAFAALCVSLVFALVYTGHDSTVFMSSILTIIPVTVGVIVVSSKVEKVNDTTAGIKERVNGQLDARFAEVMRQIDDLARTITGYHNTGTTDTPDGKHVQDPLDTLN